MTPQILKWIKIVVLRTLREKNLTRLDTSTLISAGMFGYAQSLKRFDKTRGVKFKTFAEYRIKGAVLDEVRKMIGDERCKTPRPRPVEGFNYDSLHDDSKQEKIMESQVSLYFMMRDINLDPREKEILLCRMSGMNIREIAKEFEFSESRASQLLAKIKREVYSYYEGDVFLKFGLTTHPCPSCDHGNIVSDRITEFRCDCCDLDLVLKDGTPIVANMDIGHNED